MSQAIEALCIGGPQDRKWYAMRSKVWEILVTDPKEALLAFDPDPPLALSYRRETYRYKEFATGLVPGPRLKEWWDVRDGLPKSGYYWPLWVHESVDMEEFQAQAKLILWICQMVKPTNQPTDPFRERVTP